MQIVVALDSYENLEKIFVNGESQETAKLYFPDWDERGMLIYPADIQGTRNESRFVYVALYRDRKFIGLFWSYDEAQRSGNEVIVRSYQI
jgi:hypothetical protein